MTYDVAGRRVSVDRVSSQSARVANPNYQPSFPGEPGWGTPYNYIGYTHHAREDYTYGDDDVLSSVRLANTSYYDNGDGTATIVAAPTTGTLQASFTNDAMGRLTRQIDYVDSGTNAGYDRQITYNAKGQITYEVIARKQWDGDSWDNYTDYTTTSYGTGTSYALGAATLINTQAYRFGSDSDAPDPRTVNTYAWYDGAVLSQMAFTTNINDSSPTTYYSTYSLSPSGVLTSVYVGDYRPRTVSLKNDMSGQAIRRDEADNNATNGDPHSVWYRFNGREMSTTTNLAPLTGSSYAASISERTKKPLHPDAAFAGGGIPDGDLSFEAVNSFRQGAAGGRYTARSGDTLQSIAQAVWGDSSLWYKIAEANGLSAEAILFDGQTLTLPSGVTRLHNNANTFKPYDSSEAVGDTAPTRTKPPKKPKSGLFGKILLAVIQIAVTIVLTAALSFLGPAAPVVAAMGANAVSQGVGVATGIQDKFSWKQVAVTGITAAVTMGIDTTGAFSWIANATVRAGVTAAASSAISQGIGVATGLQPKFDWVGVAAAGVGAMAGNAVGGAAAKQFGLNGSNPLDGAIYRGISIGASLIANAATRSVAQGTSFGDNVLAALPDAIAGTIGGFIEAGVAGAIAEAQRDRALQDLLPPENPDSKKDWASNMVRRLFEDSRILDGTPQERLIEMKKLLKTRDYDSIMKKYFRFVDEGTRAEGKMSFGESQTTLQNALKELFSYRTGQKQLLQLARDGRIMSMRIDNTYDSKGSPATALGDRGFIINVDKIQRDGVFYETSRGSKVELTRAKLFVIIGHELGHAVFGYSDPSWKNMRDVMRDPLGENVRKVENPLRAEAGLGPRVAYDYDLYVAAKKHHQLWATGEIR